MASKSEKQAHLFYHIATGGEDGAAYGQVRGVPVERAQQMHAEDLALGKFFDPAGKPKYDIANPRNADEMKADGDL
jgi:hypothetical protein